MSFSNPSSQIESGLHVQHPPMLEAFEAHSLRELCKIDRRSYGSLRSDCLVWPKMEIAGRQLDRELSLLLGLVQLLNLLMLQAPTLARIAVTSIAMSIATTWLSLPSCND